ncbi:MAG: DUF2318 domain-containing protein [Ruminiclostridium sp.]|nr:DUF2318 domain-containing protein [Ruminiclostridium sp.]
MKNAKQKNKKSKPVSKSSKKNLIIVTVLALLILGFVIIKALSGGASDAGAVSEDLKILKSEVSETAKFYPFKAGKTKMEVMAVKASDGTIRTAFNTCQVCFSSGRGYYVQEGDEMVCQNCGNRFQLDKIEIIKGGCNPVPIMKENKTDDGANIVISKYFLEANKGLFANWRKG